MPIPSLLAVSSVEQHLVRTKKRTAISLILESGEPRDVHQMATLLGFGARAINPYLAQECISELIDIGILDKDYHTAIEDYDKALLNGVVKTAAKMGISTLQSYQSARIFEAIGLSQEVIDKYFTGTQSAAGASECGKFRKMSLGVMIRHLTRSDSERTQRWIPSASMVCAAAETRKIISTIRRRSLRCSRRSGTMTTIGSKNTPRWWMIPDGRTHCAA